MILADTPVEPVGFYGLCIVRIIQRPLSVS
jgi:hypothetical protein